MFKDLRKMHGKRPMDRRPISAPTQTGHVSSAGYEFSLPSSRWRLCRNKSINWDLMSPYITSELLYACRRVLANYAVTKSSSHAASNWSRLNHYFRWACKNSGRVSIIEATSFANYRASLEKSHLWYVAVIAGLFRSWSNLGYDGLGDGLLPMIDNWTLPGNIKGEAVQLQDPLKGALTDIEFEAYYSSITDSFKNSEISLEDYALVMLFGFSGRRPIQLCELKGKDLVVARASDGLTEYVLNVPRAKVRGSGFRSEFKPFALNVDNGAVIEALLETNSERLADLGALDAMNSRELPLFPNWADVKAYIDMTLKVRNSLPADFMHLSSQAISSRLKRISELAPAISERTGEPLHIFPTRLRRTVGTRAARDGYGALMIAEILDHTDTQNVQVYVENIPEHVDAINEAVALQLAPIAQAFSGRLVDSEEFARRGNDPSSRVRTSEGKTAGTCGHFGFCGALAPIACYTCSSFQPWLDGPHREVLERLASENERISKITGQSPVSTVTNRTILAVTRVVQLCDERNAVAGRSK